MRYLIILLLFTGCMSVEKAEKVMRAHPKELAELCADCFPVKESEVIKGDTVVRVDSVVRIDSVKVEVVADCPDGTKVVVDCPPTKVIERVKYSHTTDTIKVRDSAQEKVLENERDEYKDKYAQEQERADSWRKWCLTFGSILLAYGIFKFVRWYIGNRSGLRKFW